MHDSPRLNGYGTGYGKPRLERFGTFRELTTLGFAEESDFAAVFGIAGCNADDTESKYGCEGRRSS